MGFSDKVAQLGKCLSFLPTVGHFTEVGQLRITPVLLTTLVSCCVVMYATRRRIGHVDETKTIDTGCHRQNGLPGAIFNTYGEKK